MKKCRKTIVLPAVLGGMMLALCACQDSVKHTGKHGQNSTEGVCQQPVFLNRFLLPRPHYYSGDQQSHDRFGAHEASGSDTKQPLRILVRALERHHGSEPVSYLLQGGLA